MTTTAPPRARRRASRLPAAGIAALLAACAPDAPPDPDASAAAATPRRVVSLAPSTTETLIELGLADRLIGISDYCPEPPPGCRATRVGGLINLNVESVLALEPDLVLTVQGSEDRAIATLRRQGVRVRSQDPQSLPQVLSSIEELGELFGAGDRARELVASLRARLDRVAERATARATAPVVYVEVDYPQCWTIGRRSFVHEALLAAGGRNCFGDLDASYAEISKEELVTREPRWVVILHPIDRPLLERPELAALAAVREGRVISDLDRNLLLRSSPRLVLGIELLAERLAGG